MEKTAISIFLFVLSSFCAAQQKTVEAAAIQSQLARQAYWDSTAQAKISLQRMPLDPAKLEVYLKISEPYFHAVVLHGSVWLTWSAVKQARGYHLYVKSRGGGKYVKINQTPFADNLSDAEANQILDALMPVDYSQKAVECKNFIYERQHIAAVMSKALGYRVTPESFPFADAAVKPYLRHLATLYYPVARIIGQAYEHEGLNPGIYQYKIVYLDGQGVEKSFAAEVTINTEEIAPLPQKPSGLTAIAGDTQALLLWDDPPASDVVNGYSVYRANAAGGPFKRVNLAPVLTKIPADLKGDSLQPPKYGYIDTALVNNTTCYYRVAALSEMGCPGIESAVASVKPADMTPPQIPQNINITTAAKKSLVISWKVVRYDTLYREERVKGYRVYRYPDYATAISTTAKKRSYYLGFVSNPVPPITVKISYTPAPPFVPLYTILDKDTCYVDQPPETEKAYWYRISCEDSAGNVGKKSAAIYGILPDFVPPDPPHTLAADPDTQCVRLTWLPPDTLLNSENRDVAGYLIYRGICGEDVMEDRDPTKCKTCYPLGLLKDIAGKKTLEYKDCSLPKNSPICYRYALKAYDKAQNLSPISDSICVRLRDRTPPDAPVITALQARNKAILIEAVAAPVQDMKGFIVERREETAADFQIVYSDSVPEFSGCDDIPVSSDSVSASKVNLLSWLDTAVEPEKVYWYQVKAFDHDGNASDPCPPVSTYTYEIMELRKPLNLQAAQYDGRVQLKWSPGSRKAAKEMRGYVLFRSLNAKEGYRQISAMIAKESFQDDRVTAGVTYWYCVQAFAAAGDRSPLSDPVSITIK